MFNKKRIFVLIVFLLLIAGLMVFASGKVQIASKKMRTVTFTDGLNMQEIAKYEIEVGKDAEVPEVPVHEGYVFTGWYDFEKQTVKITNFNNILENLHVVAKYATDANANGVADDQDDYFTVTFMDSFNNATIKSERVLVGMNATAPSAPAHVGYAFAGWNKGFSNVSKDVIVKALYNPSVVNYKVEYYTIYDGEESLYDTKSLSEKTETEVNAEIIEIKGYTYDENNKSNLVSAKVLADGSLVLKVYYKANLYNLVIETNCADEETCTFVENEESSIPSNPIEYGTKVVLPDIQKAYTLTFVENENVENKLGSVDYNVEFLGYCKNESTCDAKDLISAGTEVTVEENATYYAIYSEETIIAEFEDGEDYSITSENGYFTRWADGETEESEEVTSPLTLTSSKSVYAQYNVKGKYTVTWKNWNGTVLETDTEVEAGTVPTYDGEEPERPTDGASAYSFNGTWSPAVGAVTGDVDYVAQYDSTIRYDLTLRAYRNNVELTDFEDLIYGDRVVYTLVVTNTGRTAATLNITDPSLASSLNNITYSRMYSRTIESVTGTGYSMNVPAKRGNTNGTATLIFEFTISSKPNNTLVTNPHSNEVQVDEERTTRIESIVTFRELTDVGSNVILALDFSRGMNNMNLNSMKAAAINFINTVADGNTKVCIIAYPEPGSRQNVAVDKGCSTSAEELAAMVNSISRASQANGTSYNSAFMLIGNKLNNAFTGNETKKPYHVVFFSATTPTDTYNGYGVLANDFKSKNVTIHTVGFNVSNSTKTILQSLASSGKYSDSNRFNVLEVLNRVAQDIQTSEVHTKLGLADISNNIIPTSAITFDITDANGAHSDRSFTANNLEEARDGGYIVDGDDEVENKLDATHELFLAGDKITVSYYAQTDGTNYGKTGTVLETYMADSIALNCESVMTRGSQTLTITSSPENMYYGEIINVSYSNQGFMRRLDFNTSTLVASTRNLYNGQLFTGTETITITTSIGLTASCTIEVVSEEEYESRTRTVEPAMGLRSLSIMSLESLDEVENNEEELDDSNNLNEEVNGDSKNLVDNTNSTDLDENEDSSNDDNENINNDLSSNVPSVTNNVSEDTINEELVSTEENTSNNEKDLEESNE